jgi:hypothetical protein
VSRSRAAALVAAAAVFVAFILVSGHLPVFAFKPDVIVSTALGVALVGVMVGAAVLGRPAPRTMLVLAGAGLACAATGSLLAVVPLADLGKIALGAGLGYWLGTSLSQLAADLRVITVLAVLVGVLDTASVFLPQGPTNLLLTRAPQTIPYFVVAFPTIGYAVRDAYSALGTTDVLFFTLYLAAALGYGLRVRLTLAAMVASFIATVAIAVWSRALPALPLLSAAFLAVNADLLFKGRRPPSGGGLPESLEYIALNADLLRKGRRPPPSGGAKAP